MIAAVIASDANVDHRVAGDDALAHGLLDSLVDRGDETLGNATADDLVNELVAPARVGLETQPAITVLAGTASLLLVATLGARGAADGLAIGHAHRHDVGRDARTGGHAIEQD